MKAIPSITADIEEYPEIRKLVDTALVRIVELMEIHDIAEVRRVRKSEQFGRQSVRDVVTPLGAAGVPASICSIRDCVGKTILQYLDAIGMSGIRLSMTKEDVASVSALWAPDQAAARKPAGTEPAAQEKSDSTGDDTRISEDTAKEKTDEPTK